MLGISPEKVFEANAVGFRSYAAMVEDLYRESSLPKASAPLTIAPSPDSSLGRLVQTQLPTWTTTFEPNIASGADFVTMMQIRCGSFKLPEGFRCACSFSGENMLRHMVTCTKMRGCTAVFRHNCIVSALQRTLEDFGFLVSVEPRFYVYDDGRAKRPDITVHITPTSITTDVTVVTDGTEAEREKVSKHGKACEQLGHKFIPFVMLIDGIHTPICSSFLSEVSRSLCRSTRGLFLKTAMKATSDAWLVGTTAMIRHAIGNFQNAGGDGVATLR